MVRAMFWFCSSWVSRMRSAIRPILSDITRMLSAISPMRSAMVPMSSDSCSMATMPSLIVRASAAVDKVFRSTDRRRDSLAMARLVADKSSSAVSASASTDTGAARLSLTAAMLLTRSRVAWLALTNGPQTESADRVIPASWVCSAEASVLMSCRSVSRLAFAAEALWENTRVVTRSKGATRLRILDNMIDSPNRTRAITGPCS